MVSTGFFSQMIPVSISITDWLFLGCTLLLLLGSWGLIVLCDRLMEGGK
jgi:hypothetical protein